MKNLANCTPEEFLLQTNKIRKSLESWLTLTEIQKIRQRQPVFSEGMTPEERKEAKNKQARENFDAMLDSALEKHPKETMDLLALMCFVEPKNVNKHKMSEYLGAYSEILSDENVLSFFTSLLKLALRLGSKG